MPTSDHAPSALTRVATGVDLTSTNVRTVIFTLGHYLIDTVVISLVTGAPIAVSGIAGLISPLATGVWFWVMDRLWTGNHDRVHHEAPGSV